MERSEIKKMMYKNVQYACGKQLTESELLSFTGPTMVFAEGRVVSLAPKSKTGILKCGYIDDAKWTLNEAGARQRVHKKIVYELAPGTPIYSATELPKNQYRLPESPSAIADLLCAAIPGAWIEVNGYTSIIWFNNNEHHILYFGIDGKYNVYGAGHVKIESFYTKESCINYAVKMISNRF